MSDVKYLILMRHAKSPAARPGQADRTRPLSEQGRRDAACRGRWLASEQRLPERILCSTAARARETASCVAEPWESAVPIDPTESLYLATPEQILRTLKSDAGDARCVMVVGHNPGMEHLVGLLTGTCGHFPAAATAVLATEAASWAAISPRATWRLVGQVR